MIGLSSQPDSFDSNVLQEMAKINHRPIIFPLSNPRTQAECSFEAAMTHTKNQVLFASGTAFPPYKIPETGEIKKPGQGNNGKLKFWIRMVFFFLWLVTSRCLTFCTTVYVFPGIGLGSIVSKSKHITTSMILAAAKGLANSLTDEEIARGDLYPSLNRIRDVSATVAAHVCKVAEQSHQLQNHHLSGLSIDQLTKTMREKMWDPESAFNTIENVEEST